MSTAEQKLEAAYNQKTPQLIKAIAAYIGFDAELLKEGIDKPCIEIDIDESYLTDISYCLEEELDISFTQREIDDIFDDPNDTLKQVIRSSLKRWMLDREAASML